MIKTKRELREYIAADISRLPGICGKNMKLEFLKGNIREYTRYKFIRLLRYTEYCENNRNNIFQKVRYIYYKHLFQRFQLKTQIFIHTNVFGKGLDIEHPGFMWVSNTVVAGENCTILPRVLMGKKKPNAVAPCIFIGNNCYIGTGSTILGPVHIGNNVTIAAGSVVIRDIPDNCVVAGNPAVIKKVIDKK